MRAFTAIDIENSKKLEKLEKLQEEINYGFNKVKPEKMHITLQFFQNIDKSQVKQIKEAMQNIKLGVFEIKIKGVGVFPSRKHVRVVWAGIESNKIFELKKQASKHGVKDSNSHEFQPHITLARVNDINRTEKKKFRQKIEKHQNQTITETSIDTIKLFESIHNGQKTEYKTLKEEKL